MPILKPWALIFLEELKMNKEQVKKRIEEIEESLRQLVAQHSKFQGHLEEARFMLAEMEKMETTCGEQSAQPVAELVQDDQA
jgi:predicted  nucleic acid-binding Zn-ribbon protein